MFSPRHFYFPVSLVLIALLEIGANPAPPLQSNFLGFIGSQPESVFIGVEKDAIHVNQTVFKETIELGKLRKTLGPWSRESKTNTATLYFWDELGIVANVAPGKRVIERLELNMIARGKPTAPRKTFRGTYRLLTPAGSMQCKPGSCRLTLGRVAIKITTSTDQTRFDYHHVELQFKPTTRTPEPKT